jgi:NTE family protein
MGDYRIGLIDRPTLPIARAVAASSAFPPILSPVVIKDPGEFRFVEGADLNGNPAYTRKLFLTDGGVYDNLGLETVWNRCSTILVSDAGAPFAVNDTVATDLVRQTMRALDVATDQSRALRKRALIDDFKRGERAGAYWGIDTDIRHYELDGALRCRPERALRLAAIRTRLTAFSDQEQGELINWGYALADAAIRKHAPHLATGAPAPQWPEPAWALDR